METEAIVLETTDHGESDIIITFFSQESGKISAIAKGARKSKKRFVNKLEIFSFLHITYQQNSNRPLAFLSEADLHTSFLHIRQNLVQYTVASVMREFLMIAIKEGEPDTRVFRLSLWSLHNLGQQQSPTAVLVMFLTRFFDYVGYRPDLHTCANCREQVSMTRQYSFDAITGGLVCSTCKPGWQRGVPLSPGTIRMLQSIQDQPLERLHRLKISGNILEQALYLLHRYGQQLFQRDIKSWKILQQVSRKT